MRCRIQQMAQVWRYICDQVLGRMSRLLRSTITEETEKRQRRAKKREKWKGNIRESVEHGEMKLFIGWWSSG